MARKRLNKKVALIGSVVFLFLAFVSIALILYLSRDPAKFIKDGDAALKSARQATEAEFKEAEYKRAARNYNKARSLAENDDLKVKMFFKLANLYLETDQWRKVRGCWSKIVQIKPNNIEAGFGQLHYVYVFGDSGGGAQVWHDVASQASELIEIVEEAGLEQSGVDDFQPFEVADPPPAGKNLGSYLYLVRGRAKLTISGMGAISEPLEYLGEAISDLQKAQEFEPGNIDVYWYLAQAELSKGQMLSSRGNLDAKDESLSRAEKYLHEAMDISGRDVRAYINLLRFKRSQLKDQKGLVNLSGDFLKLTEEYPDSARAYSELSRYFQAQPLEYNKAIEASEKAIELAGDDISNLMQGMYLRYRRYLYDGDKSDFDRAIALARKSLELPGASDTLGPRMAAQRSNLRAIYLFLANCYVHQLLEKKASLTDAEREGYLAGAEDAVHQIKQLFGSGDNPYVIQWEGMLELAKGNTGSGIRKMYAAYQQLQASGIEAAQGSYLQRSYAQLSYALARYFKDTSEKGVVLNFLASSMKGGIFADIPDAVLGYAQVNLELGRLTSAMSNLDFYDENFRASQRSKTLRIRAYIKANQLQDAGRELSQSSLSEIEKLKMQINLAEAHIGQMQRTLDRKEYEQSSKNILGKVQGVISDELVSEEQEQKSQVSDQEGFMTEELTKHREELASLSNKVLAMSPEALGEGRFVSLWQNYMALGRKTEAQSLVNTFLKHWPNNVMVAYYNKLLSEPEPLKVTPQRRSELEKELYSSMTDSVRKSLNLGLFYTRQKDTEKAAGLFKKVLKFDEWRSEEGVLQSPGFEEGKRLESQLRTAASNLFEIGLSQEDWSLSEKLTDIARLQNLDGCQGEFFAARLSFAREQYEEALSHIERGLKQRPVFSVGYMLRSSINSALGNETAAIEDAREARSLNPQNPAYAKRIALLVYQRNKNLGKAVTGSQQAELQTLFDIALSLNPGDSELLGFYTEYISKQEPQRALALRQYLNDKKPNTRNALALGSLAMSIAKNQVEEKKRSVFYDIAGSAFEQALRMSPDDSRVISIAAEYYRLSGQVEKAETLVTGSKDKGVLWRHYYREGRFADAQKVLEQLYNDNSSDVSTLRGLLLMAQVTDNKAGVKRYAQKLVSVDENVENYLLEIQTYLQVGLVKEAGLRLESFKERFPDEPRALLLDAWLKMRRGQLKASLTDANRYLESNQNNTDAWDLRGKVHYLMAQYDAAISDFNKSKSISGKSQVTINLAKSYVRAGRQQEAIVELQRVVNEPKILRNARVLLAKIYKQLGRKSTLESFYDSLLRSQPNSVYWCLESAAFAVEQQEYQRAERLYKKSLQISKERKEQTIALDGYLGALLSGKKFDKLFEAASDYVNSGLGYIAFVRMAEAKSQVQDKDSALKYGRKAFDIIESQQILTTDVMERLCTVLGDKQVLSYWMDRLNKQTDSGVANLAMYWMKIRSGEYNMALDYIDKCLAGLDKTSSLRILYITKKVEAFQGAYKKTSDKLYLQKAVKEYESLLSDTPNNPLVLNNLAYLLAETGQELDKALVYSRRAYELVPNNPLILDTYSYVLYKNSKFSEASEIAKAALQQFEGSNTKISAEVYEHVGMIEEASGSKNAALSAYKQALNIGGLAKESVNRINAAIERLSE